MKHKAVLIIVVVSIVLILFSGAYTWWNNANPDKTCAGCHEINTFINHWENSAHRNFKCSFCHGTALSNGFHSIKEKTGMVFRHVTDKPDYEDIHMNEAQILKTMDNCIKCHQIEFAKWRSGGHSVNYRQIFLDSLHNAMETPYWDCLRCHGMYYDGNIYDLIEQDKTTEGNWVLKDKKESNIPVIPCLACHQIHSYNATLPKFNPENIIDDSSRNTPIYWYIRGDKRHRRADNLMNITMFNNGDTILTSAVPTTKLCLQCHSTNFKHEAGKSDDRTPTGVHEGLSCASCHETHSNSTKNSCMNCHPAISNCGLDVTKMNTTYSNAKSPNNIHWLTCTTCHDEKGTKVNR